MRKPPSTATKFLENAFARLVLEACDKAGTTSIAIRHAVGQTPSSLAADLVVGSRSRRMLRVVTSELLGQG